MRLPLLALAACSLTACAAGSAQQLGGGTWRVMDINGVPVVGERPVTLVLDGGRISGNAGCNSYSGTYALSSRQGIRLVPGAVTRMLCHPPAVMEQEARFLDLLRAVQGHNRYSNGDLSLIAGDGRALRLRRI